MKWWTKLVAYLSATDERTWIGHTIQGVGIQFLFVAAAVAGIFPGPTLACGVAFNAGFWIQREVVTDYIQQIPKLGFRRANRKFRKDNWQDLMFPMMGTSLGAIIAAVFLVH